MKKHELITMLIGLSIFLLIILTVILIINLMGKACADAIIHSGQCNLINNYDIYGGS